MLAQIFNDLNWETILLGEEKWEFLIETSLRTLIMFIVILTGLRLLGKRGVKQLSVFELVVIIGLGSAAGDPMFYKDVGVLPALIVFAMIIVLYRLVTYFIGKNKRFEILIEGKSVCLIKDGVFALDNFKKEPLGEDEFFAELRINSISHLGQIEQAIVETSGNISIFYYADEEVKYGLPVMPGTIDRSVKAITEAGYYSCVFCGYTQKFEPVSHSTCPTCKKDEWVKSSNRKRNC